MSALTWHRVSSKLQMKESHNRKTNTFSQYGAYWAFASGVDVLDYYLYLAKTLNDKTAWVKQALVYVGFSESAAADPGKQQLVIFDQDKMDEQWLAGTPNGEHGRKSLQPIWKDEGEDIFDYLGSPFQVCFNPDKENGNTVTDASMCTEKTVKIEEDVIADMLATNYEKLTGCTGGYPYPEGLKMTKADCEANCPGENGVEYCSYSAPMSTANRESNDRKHLKIIDYQYFRYYGLYSTILGPI